LLGFGLPFGGQSIDDIAASAARKDGPMSHDKPQCPSVHALDYVYLERGDARFGNRNVLYF
jgi:hypothetical protein